MPKPRRARAAELSRRKGELRSALDSQEGRTAAAVLAVLALHASSARALVGLDQRAARRAVDVSVAALAQGLAETYLDARVRAREAGWRTTTHYLTRDGVELPAERSDADGAEQDAVHARTTATAQASAWGLMALGELRKAKASEPGALERAFERANEQLTPRLRTGAVHENASAFNAGIGDVAAAAAEIGVILSREWVADVDERTCKVCEALDQLVVEGDDEFPEGDPPLHVRCRCYVLLHLGVAPPRARR
ncbi:MAG TPA: phage minor head protein [Polyangiaceae bacterium]|jgi:hypothetical protein